MDALYIYTASEIITQLGAQYRVYRKMAKLTQKEVAKRAGVSAITLYKFETGIAQDISLSTLIRLLRVIDQLDNLRLLLPPIPESPYSGQTRDFKIPTNI